MFLFFSTIFYVFLFLYCSMVFLVVSKLVVFLMFVLSLSFETAFVQMVCLMLVFLGVRNGGSFFILYN